MAAPNPLPLTIPDISLSDLTLLRPVRVDAIHQDVVEHALVVSAETISTAIRDEKLRFLQLIITGSDTHQREAVFLFAEMHRLAVERTLATLEEKLGGAIPEGETRTSVICPPSPAPPPFPMRW